MKVHEGVRAKTDRRMKRSVGFRSLCGVQAEWFNDLKDDNRAIKGLILVVESDEIERNARSNDTNCLRWFVISKDSEQ